MIEHAKKKTIHSIPVGFFMMEILPATVDEFFFLCISGEPVQSRS
jgi:hypothetical protein